MALPAGRVGVAKDQVDEFGSIIGGGTPENVYTKTQCDNKFETKTHASNTYVEKGTDGDFTIASGTDAGCELSKEGIFAGLIVRTNGVSGTQIGSLPSGYRPRQTITVAGYVSGVLTAFYLSTDGNVTSSESLSGDVRLNVVYLI